MANCTSDTLICLFYQAFRALYFEWKLRFSHNSVRLRSNRNRMDENQFQLWSECVFLHHPSWFNPLNTVVKHWNVFINNVRIVFYRKKIEHLLGKQTEDADDISRIPDPSCNSMRTYIWVTPKMFRRIDWIFRTWTILEKNLSTIASHGTRHPNSGPSSASTG